jgi:toxin ParE1/3/4
VKVRFTAPADRDVSAILSESYRLFGENQTVRYAEIIKVGIALVSDEPDRPASKERGDIGAGVRSLHLRFAAKRHSGASHVIYYRITRSSGNSPELVVLRILGDRMEPRRRVASALRADERG